MNGTQAIKNPAPIVPKGSLGTWPNLSNFRKRKTGKEKNDCVSISVCFVMLLAVHKYFLYLMHVDMP